MAWPLSPVSLLPPPLSSGGGPCRPAEGPGLLPTGKRTTGEERARSGLASSGALPELEAALLVAECVPVSVLDSGHM